MTTTEAEILKRLFIAGSPILRFSLCGDFDDKSDKAIAVDALLADGLIKPNNASYPSYIITEQGTKILNEIKNGKFQLEESGVS